MKELQELTGGYKRHMDYLLTLQSEVLGVQNALFKNLGHDLVLSGCEVTNHNNGTVSIAAGVVYVGGEILRFAGAANIESTGTKALTKSAPVTTDPDEFFDGSMKNTYKETFAVVANVINAAVQIVVKPILYDVKNYIQDVVQSYGQKGEIKDVYDMDGLFLDNFDSSGLGTTPRWVGWARVNGNNGTPNGQGRTRIGVGKITSDGVEYTYANGATGGNVKHKLVVNELAKHSHSLNLPTMNFENDGSSGPDVGRDGSDNRNFPAGSIGETGGDVAHNNMQPYIAVYAVMRIV